jgi:tetratricopeptide (TPR) repeat protein
MSKLFLLYIIIRLTGNPILALIILVAIYYLLDRRYIGLLPSVTKPFRKRFRVSRLRKQLDLNAHDMNTRYELAQAYIESKNPSLALDLLRGLPQSMQESADVIYDIGVCHLLIGDLPEGENLTLQALTIKNNLRYGEPYMALATAYSASDPVKALHYLTEFQAINHSSCECYYRMGELHSRLGNRTEALKEWKHCIDTFHSLPKFRKRNERRWAFKARLKLRL